MAWLGKGRHKKPSKDEQEEERRQREAEAARSRNHVQGPPLVLLAPDVAGVSSYRMHRLRDAAAARDFVQSSLSWQKKSGINIHAFWALQYEPATESGSPPEGDEAIVLIRTGDGSDTVYVVSFVDIESAQSFARFEVKRGLGLGLIMIYWASLVTITELDGEVRVIPEFPTRAEARPAAARAPGAAPVTDRRGPDDARRRQLEEKKRLQEELAEMQRRQVISEQRRRQLEEKRKLEAEVAEMRRRQAETEALREAEGSGARGGTDETGRGLEEEDQRRLQAEAEEVAELKTQAEALRKQQAEAQEIARLKAQAQTLRKQLAEAEEQLRLGLQQRQIESEATGEQDTEAAEKERVQSNTEERRRLEAELADVQRRQAEAEERHRQAEVLGNRRRETIDDQRHAEAEAREQEAIEEEQRHAEPEAQEQEAIEETRQQVEAEDVIWSEAAAEEVARFNAGSAAVETEPPEREGERRWEDAQAEGGIRDEEFESEVSRSDGEAEDSLAIGEWPPRLPVDAADGRTVERPKTRSLPEALEEISPGLAEALQKAAQDRDAHGLQPAAPIDSGTAAEPTGDTGTEVRPPLDEWAVEEAAEEQVRGIDDDTTDPQQNVVPQPSQDTPIPTWLRHEGPPEADTELAADEAFGDEEIEEGAARDGAVAAEPPFETPAEQIGKEENEKETAEARAARTGSNGAHDAEPEELSVEVAKMLGKRRWEKRDSPFRGFDSPPGRF